jgi:hypothetical protein
MSVDYYASLVCAHRKRACALEAAMHKESFDKGDTRRVMAGQREIYGDIGGKIAVKQRPQVRACTAQEK